MATKDARNLKIGDIVEVRWTDVWTSDRSTWDDVSKLDELDQTKSYGVVIAHMKTCVVIASEIGDRHGDGHTVTQMPYGLIESVRVLGHTEVLDA